MTPPAIPLSPGLSYIDLNFLRQPKAIATAVVNAPGFVALIDPGPSTSIESLELGLQAQGVKLDDVTVILLTHIHIDHAGATGILVRRNPAIEVFVHERGATHLSDPSKLIESAARYFGPANMKRFWGEIAPVPEDHLRLLRGGEHLDVGGRTFEVLYTPGHASHHVTYFDRSSGIAFVGDAAGMRISGGYVLPPTPPPDIHVERWIESIGQISALRPHTVFVTHFGPIGEVETHLQTLAANLRWMSGLVRESFSEDATDEERSRRFGARLRREMLQRTDPTVIPAYEPTAPLETLWFGLARDLRKNQVEFKAGTADPAAQM
jgi:glyoxylase-like metal-dependent hydrolase (beta-lactamase superfamily II)